MCFVVRVLVLFALCLAVVVRAGEGVNPVTEGSTERVGASPVPGSEAPASPTEAPETSSTVSTVADTQNSTSASSSIAASTLVVPLLPALMLGY